MEPFDPHHNQAEVKAALDALDEYSEGGEKLAAVRVGTCKGCFHCTELQVTIDAVNICCAAEASPATTYRAVVMLITEEIIKHFGTEFTLTEDDVRKTILYERNWSQTKGNTADILRRLAAFFHEKEKKSDELQNTED